ncbi:MAG TPA: non-homologous end-joining DNA ligase [Acidimicrobiales bacterium]|jgi:bifunctional non-homologous end joining protein LigD|nr:non-homologous end-joining DNA ligase [Acidimicrobiales bacterium]
MSGTAKEVRHGVELSNLDQPLFDGADATKRDLIDYLEGVADRLVPVLSGRALSVIRVHRGDEPFMQKNLPKYTPEWVRSVTMWAESSKRDVTYAVVDDLRTLLWFGNQRAVEYHPSLSTVDAPDRISHLVLDLDPPPGDTFKAAVAAAHLVHAALDDVGLRGAVKTSGAKGVHVFVPIASDTEPSSAAAATRAIAERAAALDPSIATTAFLKEDREGKVFVDSTRAGGATVVSAYSPRARSGTPVSFPVRWDELDEVRPAEITIRTALERLGSSDPWAADMPTPQEVPAELVEEGGALPVPRVAAMHEGRRRARTRRKG